MARASPEALAAVLAALGAGLDRPDDAAGAARARRLALARRVLEPVTVAWEGRLRARVRVPARWGEAPLRLELALEGGGEAVRWEVAPRPLAADEVEGIRFATLEASPPGPVPFGYHALQVERDGERWSSLVVSAPRRCPSAGERSWGVFLPLHALRTGRSLGLGDLSDLGELAEWVGGLGGAAVATLPLLAAFLDQPLEPSPYAPASRLFWNELYVDPRAIPELDRSEEARGLLGSGPVRLELEALGALPLVDYRRVAAARRRVLEALARAFFEDGAPGRRAAFEAFLRSNPVVVDYARFRAAGERYRATWRAWPAPDRDGALPDRPEDEPARRYHLYAQWVASEQVADLARRAGRRGVGLYADLPVGVHPDGYDPWREREAFLHGLSAGAPPDPLFAGGQNWGFPPLSPEGVRAQGYRYVAACLRHLMAHARVVRLDHVMGLHRMFVVPHGMDPTQGLYLRYRPEEWYAVLALEASRHGAVVVGEDLGTVPAAVRRAMATHRVHRTFVLQFELPETPGQPLPAPPARAAATLGTHDLPPFASFWRGRDLELRRSLGWLTEEGLRAGRARRDRTRRAVVEALRRSGRLAGEGDDEGAILRALLRFLAESQAALLVVNLEDLWLETEPHNIPGTTQEHPNWRRRARHPLEAFRSMPAIVGTLREVDAARRGRKERG
ncbi:MAG TPA: 4-alpha-glucanotransferase [Actinomycetota bacterium]|nr:4-alpha-glucanotransferase [Actinomycetota bacterium]